MSFYGQKNRGPVKVRCLEPRDGTGSYMQDQNAGFQTHRNSFPFPSDWFWSGRLASAGICHQQPPALPHSHLVRQPPALTSQLINQPPPASSWLFLILSLLPPFLFFLLSFPCFPLFASPPIFSLQGQYLPTPTLSTGSWP